MSHHWGYVGALLSAVLFGLVASLNKILLVDVDPLVVAGLTYFTAGTTLLVINFTPARKKILALLETPSKSEESMTRRDYMLLLAITLFGSILAPLFFNYGLANTTAANSSLLLNTETLFTILIAFAFLGERLLKKDYTGIGILILGSFILTVHGSLFQIDLSEGLLGNMLILLACLFWGIDNNLSRKISIQENLIQITAIKCSLGGSILLLSSFPLGIGWGITLLSLPYLFIVGTLGIGFSLILFLLALREIGVSKTGVIFSTSTMFGVIFAFLFLGETISLIQISVGLMMILGIYLVYRSQNTTLST